MTSTFWQNSEKIQSYRLQGKREPLEETLRRVIREELRAG